MQLEPNMCVRTKDGELHKCLIIHKDNTNPTLDRFMNEWGNMIMFDEIKGEPSHNIIDLIEEDDYVNGDIVTKIKEDKQNNKYIVTVFNDVYRNENIKTIVTWEQFVKMQYKVGE